MLSYRFGPNDRKKGGRILPKNCDVSQKNLPELDPKSLEQIALNHFLSRLTNPQVVFAVRQQRPKKLEESYLLKPAVVGNITPEVDEYTVEAIGSGSGATGSMPQSSEQTLDASN